MAIQLSLFSETITPTTSSAGSLTFRGQAIRIARIDEQGKTWLVGQDLCRSLNHVHTEAALRKVPPHLKALSVMPGSTQARTIVCQDGLLSIEDRSDDESAEDYVGWVRAHFGNVEIYRAVTPILRTFELGALTLRVVEVDATGRLGFVGKDATDSLGYPEAANALRRIPALHKDLRWIQTPGGPQPTTILSEPGLYQLILRSDRQEAGPFITWVTEDVLPEIRRTGSYSRPGSALAPSTDPAVLALLTELVTLNRQALDAGRARERLARFPPSWQIPPDRLRMRMEDLIDTVAEVREWPRNSVIRQINRVVRDWHHIDFNRRKWWVDRPRGKHVSILSVIEHYGKLPLVYDFILSYYRDDLMATPQRRLSDVPLDRDDPMTEEERQLLKVMEFAMGGSPQEEAE